MVPTRQAGRPDLHSAARRRRLTLGVSLLLPIVPAALAGLGLAGFFAGLLGLYLRIPGMRQDGSRPTAQGTPLAKDAWLLGIGLSFVIDAILSRGDDTG